MVLKVLAIAVVLVLVYIIFFKKDREKTMDKKHKDDKIEDIMVECPACGTYVSKKEAILSNGFYFCSKECLLKGKK